MVAGRTQFSSKAANNNCANMVNNNRNLFHFALTLLPPESLDPHMNVLRLLEPPDATQR